MKDPLLVVDHLSTRIYSKQQYLNVLDDICFTLDRGKTLAVVGESGCGKSMLCKSLVRLFPRNITVADNARISFDGHHLHSLARSQMNKIRGRRISMIFQDSVSSLNPVLTIGEQITEVIVHHLGLEQKTANEKAKDLLDAVGIANPGMRLFQYAHQLSGGMCQRVAIAIAIACDPQLLIADEPTTSLDVTVQIGILDLLKQLQAKKEMALILVTHDMQVASYLADDIAVMRNGKIVDTFPVRDLSDKHIAKRRKPSIPRVSEAADQSHNQSLVPGESALSLLTVENLNVDYSINHGRNVQAVSGVSFRLRKGEVLGVVGESGCGKSSLAHAIMQLPTPSTGRVQFKDHQLTAMSPSRLRQLRPYFQMIFQNSLTALNPRRPVGETIGMPLKTQNGANKKDRIQKAYTLIEAVGLDNDYFSRRPHELSGGQCQRIQIARALITEPELLICDEPVSSLDVFAQQKIVKLLLEVKCRLDLTMIFISHDLSIVKLMADRIAVMYLGKFCEVAPSNVVYGLPAHPYTNALLKADINCNSATTDRTIEPLRGEIPSPIAPPSGCRFHTRCPHAFERCTMDEPKLTNISGNHFVACHLASS